MGSRYNCNAPSSDHFVLMAINFLVEWHLFACFLTQKYVSTKSYPAPDWRKIKTKEDWKKLSEEEKEKLRQYFKDVHDRVLQVMKEMPGPLLLISRLGSYLLL